MPAGPDPRVPQAPLPHRDATANPSQNWLSDLCCDPASMTPKIQTKEQPAANLLPSASQLAQLVPPGEEGQEGLENAMRRYVQAALFLEGLPRDRAELIRRFGNEEQRQPLLAGTAKLDELLAPVELDPRKSNDDARKLLAKYGLELKDARSVLRRAADYLSEARQRRPEAKQGPIVWERDIGNEDDDDQPFEPSFGSYPGTIESYKQGEVYRFPKALLLRVAQAAEARRHATKRKAWKARKAKPSN